MKKTELKKVAMYKVVDLHFKNSLNNVEEPVPGLLNMVADFRGKLQLIDESALTQRKYSKGATANKLMLRTALTDRSMDVVRKLRAFAVNMESHDLAAKANYSRSKLNQMSGGALLDHCRIIHKLAVEALEGLKTYGVSAQMLDGLLAAIAAFADAKQTPRKNIVKRKVATERLGQLFSEIDQLLVKTDILVAAIGIDTDFYRLYKLSRALTDAGFRKLSVRGRVKDENGNNLANVLVKAGALKKKIVTTDKGNFSIRRLKGGSYIFTFTKPGYIDYEAEVAVVRGDRAEVSVMMCAVPAERVN